jgi:hypothetical protein
MISVIELGDFLCYLVQDGLDLSASFVEGFGGYESTVESQSCEVGDGVGIGTGLEYL